MIHTDLTFPLPIPWNDRRCTLHGLGPINYLVGPNGTGKSRFVTSLLAHLGDRARLLGTDRLSGMGQYQFLGYFHNDPFASGIAKNTFSHLKTGGKQGSGLDTIVLLEEDARLLMQVEATLSHLFDRDILLEWDSGHLVPKMRRPDGVSYRLDHDECHGIKELLVLLTHLYHTDYSHLIIDEPELNLHPQYQAFFMNEARKFAGDPSIDAQKKILFLVTHSPFILDFRSEDDVRSVISFTLDYSAPVQVSSIDASQSTGPLLLARRLNAHHKQFFFSDNPIFVEGIYDARLLEAIFKARGTSVGGAGSCIIDAGGSEEVNQYFALCERLGKRAHFVYDLDSLFAGNLRACIRNDESVENFLAAAGLGTSFAKYCGELDRQLTSLVDALLSAAPPSALDDLMAVLKGFGQREKWNRNQHARVRTALLTAISLHSADMTFAAFSPIVMGIQGRIGRIVAALREKNVHLLAGGTIERYLPSYVGNPYILADEAKRRAILQEIEELARPHTESELSHRYGDLYDAVQRLPSKAAVDLEPTVRQHLSRYIFELQQAVLAHPDYSREQLEAHLSTTVGAMKGVFSLREFAHGPGDEIDALVEVAEMTSFGKKFAKITQVTNAAMQGFELQEEAVLGRK